MPGVLLKMLERDLKRYAAYFRGWCQAFGEHESIYRDNSGINWLTAPTQLGLVLPTPLIKELYREVLLHEQAPSVKFRRKFIEIGSLEIPIEKKHQKLARNEITKILEDSVEVHVFQQETAGDHLQGDRQHADLRDLIRRLAPAHQTRNGCPG